MKQVISQRVAQSNQLIAGRILLVAKRFGKRPQKTALDIQDCVKVLGPNIQDISY